MEQEGRYYSEFDGKYIDRAEHRYVLSVRAMDSTADVYLNLFNEQVRRSTEYLTHLVDLTLVVDVPIPKFP